MPYKTPLPWDHPCNDENVIPLRERTIPRILAWRAQNQPDKLWGVWSDEKAEAVERMTYLQLQTHAAAVAHHLREDLKVPARTNVILCYSFGLEFMSAFIGALMANVIPIPVCPPDPTDLRRRLPGFKKLVEITGSEYCLTDTLYYRASAAAGAYSKLSGLFSSSSSSALTWPKLNWVVTNTLPAPKNVFPQWEWQDIEELAYVQFTSGSTQDPKGSLISHRNVLENLDHIIRQAECGRGDEVVVSWLPHYHDMGLVGVWLMTIYGDVTGVWFSPLVFIKHPNTWLTLVHKFNGTHMGAPNFGYQIAADKYDGRELDLHRLRFMWSGAEHIKPSTMRKWVSVFGPKGFQTRAFRPTYGLAENVLMVACHPGTDDIEDYIDDETGYLYCGAQNYGVTIRLIDPKTGADVTDTDYAEGEIWVHSDSRAEGYYNLPEATAEAFDNHVPSAPGLGFLRTGDLGKFVPGKKMEGVHKRQLIITGRIKELIIVNGKNLYPHDVEYVFDLVGDGTLRAGCAVVFGLKKPVEETTAPLEDGADSIRVVGCAEVKDDVAKDPSKYDLETLCRTIARRVFQSSGITLDSIHLLQPRQIPKSSSGKIQRTACSGLYTEGKFKIVHSLFDIQGLIRADVLGHVADALGLAAEDREQLSALGGNLLDTGVDSLKLAQLVQSIRSTYGVTIDFQTLFEDGSLDGLVDTLMTSKHAAPKKVMASDMFTGPPVESFPATSGQSRLFFLSTSSSESNRAYHLMYKVFFDVKDADPTKLNEAVQAVVDANDVLRTIFDVDDHGNVVGLVAAPGAPADADRLLPDLASEAAANKQLDRFAAKSFDIRRQVFDYRLVVLPAKGDSNVSPCILVLKVHHIAFDGPSAQAFLHQVFRAYVGDKLENVTPQFSRFAIQHQQDLAEAGKPAEQEKKEALRSMWKRVFATSVPTLTLPHDASQAEKVSGAGPMGDLLITRLDQSIVKLVSSYARSQRCTEAVVLQTLFGAFIGRLTNSDDLLLASPISMRSTETADVIGFMINTTIRRCTYAPKADGELTQSFADLIAAATEQHVAYLNDPAADFETINNMATEGLARAQKGDALQLWFNYHRFVTALPGSVDSKGGIHIDKVALIPTGSTKFPLGLEVDVEDDAYVCQWEFSTRTLHRTTVESWAHAFPAFVQGVLANTAEPIKSVPIVSGSEAAEELLAKGPTFGEPTATKSTGFTLHGMFLEAVKRFPTRMCFADMSGMTMTYEEADHFSSYVAGFIDRSARHSNRDPCVALALNRGPLMINCMLAVLKTGCHFIPLDLTNPLERNKFFLTDSPPCMLVADDSTIDTYGNLGICDTLNLSETWTDYQLIGREGKQRLAEFSFQPTDVSPSTLAYKLYTSGSTGTPKACMLEHRNSVSSVLSHVKQMEWADAGAPRVLQFSRYTFDHSILEIFGTFASRGTLVTASLDEILSDLPKVINRMKANILVLTPTVALTLPNPEELPTVSTVVLSGERTPEGFKNTWLSAATAPRLFNLYGPTEAGIHTFIHEMKLDTTSALIGRPLGCTGSYLLDEQEHLVPQGGVGEIWVMGEHIGRGYFKREELTAATFKPLAVYGDNKVIFHKTGDLARQLPSGEFILLGRKDRQIKVRGVRVEPEEIEETIRKCDAVTSNNDIRVGRVAVILKKLPAMMEPQLVAFMEVAAPGEEPHPPADRGAFEALGAHHDLYSTCSKVTRRVRTELAKRLPPHMIPLHIVPTLRLPLTSSGKTDRTVLANCVLPAGIAQNKHHSMDIKRRSMEVSLVGPLTDVFSELLGHGVEPDGDLFEQGLTSLTAMRALAMVRRNLDLQQQLTVADVMRHPTIRALSNHLKPNLAREVEENKNEDIFACQIPQRHDPFPLTELQSAYVVGSEDDVELGGISPVTYIELCFPTGTLDMERMQLAWNSLVGRHEALRIVIDKASSTQRILPISDAHYEISTIDMSTESLETQKATLEQARIDARCDKIDIGTWPLFNVQVIQAEATYFTIAVHLIIVDAKSFVTLMKDLTALYAGRALPPLELSYRDYVVWHRNGEHDAVKLAEAKSYWSERVKSLPLAPAIPSNPEVLPKDLSGESLQVKHLAHTISRPTWDALTKLARDHGIMPSALIIATFSQVVARWSESSNFTMNLTLFNREPVHPSVDDVVGDFTGGLLFEADCSQRTSFYETCKRVQDSLRNDLQNTAFGSVSVLRELRRVHPQDNIIMPVVMTCLLEEQTSATASKDFPAHTITHRFTQTPQVSIDFQAVLFDDGLHLHLDFFEVAYPMGLPAHLFNSTYEVLQHLPHLDWRNQPLQVELGADLVARQATNSTSSSNVWSAVLPGREPVLLHEAFFKTAEMQPERVAVVAEDGTVTYSQLARAALAVSRMLEATAAGTSLKGQVIPVNLDRSWRQIAAVLGVLHAGGTYLPLSSQVPLDRATTIMEDAKCRVIIGTDDVADKYAGIGTVESFVSMSDVTEHEAEAETREAAPWQPTDPAYIIYTSGSTGKPKGVVISHEAALNTIADVIYRFGITCDDVCIGLAKLDFDLSVYDIFGTLSIGGRLALPAADAQEDSSSWVEFVSENQVSVWNTVPAMMELLLANARAKKQEDLVQSIRIGLLSGDKVSLSLLQQLETTLPRARVWSLGGATEAAIWSLYNPLSGPHPNMKSPVFGGRVIYGVPLANQQLHVLNDNFEDCPTLVPGQLYISGKGLAIGYTDDIKTREAFVVHPRTNQRLYKTGDLCRYLPDGRTEIIGRTDFQRKIRGGHRVELGEIERQLADINGIGEAVVDVRSDVLVAYVTGEKGGRQFDAELHPEDGYELLPVDDRLSFKLERRGILRMDEEPAFSLAIPFDSTLQDAAIRRKSYRSFAPSSDASILSRLVEIASRTTSLLPQPSEARAKGDRIDVNALRKVLGGLLFYSLDQPGAVSLTKARYPSAGSSYSVRTYLLCPPGTPGFPPGPGVYYLDPIGHRLVSTGSPVTVPTKSLRLVFTSFRPAIAPLYGQFGRTFAHSEVGYILGVLARASALEDLQLNYQESNLGTAEELGLSTEEYIIGHASIEKRTTASAPVLCSDDALDELRVNICVQGQDGISWESCLPPSKTSSDTSAYQQGVVHFHENGDIIHGAQFLVGVGCASPLRASVFAQIMMEEALSLDVGFCHIPHISDAYNKDFARLSAGQQPLFVLAGGHISEEQQTSLLTQTAPGRAKQMIQSRLREKLPRYMVPDIYVPLSEIPLTANGKVDRKRLASQPLPDSAAVTGTGEPPQTETEKRLAILWTNILSIPGTSVTRDASFFDLGGHSMSALKLQQSIKEEFSLNLSLKAFFDCPGLEAMARKVDEVGAVPGQARATGDDMVLHADLENRHEPFPTTQIQQAYLLGRNAAFRGGSVATHSYLEFHKNGAFPLEEWTTAFRALIRRHEALRLVFDADTLTQKILPEEVAESYKLTVTTVSRAEGPDTFELLRQTTHDGMSHQVLDPSQWPLFDMRVTCLDSERYVIHASFDMLVMDFYSSAILASDFQHVVRGDEAALLPVDVSFRDYVLALDRFTETDMFIQHKKYWMERVHSFPNAPSLPANTSPDKSGAFVRAEDTLSLAEWKRLDGLAKSRGLLSTSVIAAIFSLVLGCWSETKRFALNLTVFDRKTLHKNINNIMGDFTSSLLLEVETAESNTFDGLVKAVNNQLLEDLSHASFTGVDFLRALRSATNTDRPMGVVLTSVLHEFEVSSDLSSLDDTVGSLAHSITQTSQVSLDFQALMTASGLLMRWDYVEDDFPAGLIPEIHRTFMQTARSLASSTQDSWIAPLTSMLPLSPLSAVDPPSTSFLPGPQHLHEGFYQASAIHGDRTAVVSTSLTGDEISVTYTQLMGASLHIESILSGQVQPKNPVAVLLPRGWLAVASVYGVLNAGAYYIPLDVELPAQRINAILDASGCSVILTSLGSQERLQHEVLETVKWISLDEADVLSRATSIVRRSWAPKQAASDVAYIIFTSGSTGTPKGVIITHEAAMNTITDINQRFDVGTADVMLGLAKLNFDLSVYDVFGTLALGAKLVLPSPTQENDPAIWAALMRQHGVTFWNSVPMMMQMLLTVDDKDLLPVLPALRVCLLSGDRIPLQLPRRLQQLAPHVRAISLGGATEASIWSIFHEITPEDVVPSARSIPYGRPLTNQEILVVDMSRKPWLLCPAFAVGSIFIGGVGLAKGYTSAAQTAKAFFDVPEISSRFYDTGDLGRVMPSGAVEILGRRDFQVKVRGHRIELEEIEYHLLKMASIDEAVVNVSNGQLAAYYVPTTPNADHSEIVADAKRQLSKAVPGYMVPSFFIELPELPLSRNGKVDRKALPPVDFTDKATRIAPRNDTESELVGLTAEILQLPVEDISITSGFVALGGHSLTAIRLRTAIRKRFGVQIELAEMLSDITLEDLGRTVDASAGTHTVELTHRELVHDPQQKHAPFPLTPIQGAYLLGRTSQLDLGGVSTHIYLELVSDDLDIGRFEAALNALITRHDSLRLVFDLATQTQRVLPEVPHFTVPIMNQGEELDSVLSDAVRQSVRDEMSHQVLPADSWPLFDFRVTQLSAKSSVIHISMDMLIMDFSSLMIMTAELKHLLSSPSIDTAGLQPLGITFRDYAVFKEELRTGPDFEAARKYWTDRTATFPKGPTLPLSVRPESVATPHFARCEEIIPSSERQNFERLCQSARLTPTAVLGTLFCMALERFSESSNFTINLTIFDREPLHQDIFGVVGDFTTSLFLEYAGSVAREPFTDRARALQTQLLRDLQHVRYSGVDFARHLRRARTDDVAIPVVFTSVMTQAAGGEEEASSLGRLEYSISQTPQIWLDFQAQTLGNGDLAIRFEYLEQIFPAGMMEGVHSTLLAFLRHVARSPDLARISVDTVHATLAQPPQVATANDTAKSLSGPVYLHQGFHEQVSRHFDSLAVVSGHDDRVTYGELYHTTRSIGHAVEQSKRQGTVVAILLERSWQQLAAGLAAGYAGVPFVPLDADVPPGRLATIVSGANASAIITHSKFVPRYEGYLDNLTVIDVDEHDARGKPMESGEISPFEAPVGVSPEDAAYIIFTSGSTGTPKGVVISHQGAMNTINDIIDRFGLSQSSVVLNLARFNFDLSIFDFFGSAAMGSLMVMPAHEDQNEPTAWLDLLRQYKVTCWNSVPTMMRMIADTAASLKRNEDLQSLRLVMLSGDRFPLSLAKVLLELLPSQCRLVSLGGATEASIWSIYHDVTSEDIRPENEGTGAVLYGKPLANQRFAVLDANFQPRPTWVPGDLMIMGDGLAIGYSDPEITARSFVRSPQKDSHERYYRTGDMGRYLPNGEIEFLGRKDAQVKIRGHRIELGEVEHWLQRVHGIQNTACDVKDGKLIAFVVPSYPLPEPDPLAPYDLLRTIMDRAVYKRTKAEKLVSSLPAERTVDRWPDHVAMSLARRSHRQYTGDVTLDRLATILATPPQHNVVVEAQSDWPTAVMKTLHTMMPVIISEDPAATEQLKYRWPSAGSSYSVKVCLSVKDVKGFADGIHTFNEFSGAITHVAGSPIRSDKHLEIVISSHIPAIAPLYGKASLDFARAEVGYIIAMLQDAANDAHLSANYSPVSADDSQRLLPSLSGALEDDDVVLGTMALSDTAAQVAMTQPQVSLFVQSHVSGGNGWMSLRGRNLVKADLNSQFNPGAVYFSDNASIIDTAHFILGLTGASIEETNAFCQRLMERAVERSDVGFCQIPYVNEFFQRDFVSLRSSTPVVLLAGGSLRPSIPALPVHNYPLMHISHKLESQLPHYMIPTHLEIVPEIPLSANGKVDRKQLRAMTSIFNVADEAVFEPLETDEERAMAAIWADVLELELDTLHKNSSFFELGGHSLLAIRLQAAVNKTFSVQASLRMMFENATLAKMTEAVLRLEHVEQDEEEEGEAEARLPATHGHSDTNGVNGGGADADASSPDSETGVGGAAGDDTPSDLADYAAKVGVKARELGSTRPAISFTKQAVPTTKTQSLPSLSQVKSLFSKVVTASSPAGLAQNVDPTSLRGILTAFVAGASPAARSIYPFGGVVHGVFAFITVRDPELASSLNLRRGTYFIDTLNQELRYVCSPDEGPKVSVAFVGADGPLRRFFGPRAADLVFSELGCMSQAFEEACNVAGVTFLRREQIGHFAPAYIMEDELHGPAKIVISYGIGASGAADKAVPARALLYVKNGAGQTLPKGLYDANMEPVQLSEQDASAVNMRMDRELKGKGSYAVILATDTTYTGKDAQETVIESGRLAARVISEGSKHGVIVRPGRVVEAGVSTMLEAHAIRVHGVLIGGQA